MNIQYSRRAAFLVQNLDLAQATGVPTARWEYFQLYRLNDATLFSIDRKSRQIAWSWFAAAEALAEAILDGQSSVFVSINKDEAQNKLTYIRDIFAALRIHTGLRFVRDNATMIMLSNGAELLSYPSRPPRGRPRRNYYFDEFAHVQQDRQIIQGGIGAIAKGGRLRIGSSPMGASGVFWEIDTQSSQPYPDYDRLYVPWWSVYSFCHDPIAAIRSCRGLRTEERVERFGNDRIKAIYRNSLLEDFQQEYEAVYIDETTAWLTWQEIRSIENPDLRCFKATAYHDQVASVLHALAEFANAIQRGIIESVFGVGVDVGRTRDTTEMYAVARGTDGRLSLRLMITLDNCRFDTQELILAELLAIARIVKMQIDRNGLGMQLAETMSHRYLHIVDGVNFTNASKAQWATHLKSLVAKNEIVIPVDTNLAYQLHSIKKMISGNKNIIFDTARNEKHHADKFWALALAIDSATHGISHRATPPPRGSGTLIEGL